MKKFGRVLKIGLPLLVILSFVVIGTIQRNRKAQPTGKPQRAQMEGKASPGKRIGVRRTTESTYQEEFDENEVAHIRTTERRFFSTSFHADSVNGDKKDGYILIHEEKTKFGVAGESPYEAEIKVTAWDGDDYRNKIWEVEQEGNIGYVTEEKDFYKITKYGCCTVLGTDSYYSLATGEKIYQGTAPQICVYPKETEKPLSRFITIQGVGGVLKHPELEANPEAIAILQYGTNQKAMFRILVTKEGRHDEFDGYLRCLVDQNGTRSEKEDIAIENPQKRPGKQALSGFSIILKSGDGQEISIPIRNDALDLKNAVVPAGLGLRLLK